MAEDWSAEVFVKAMTIGATGGASRRPYGKKISIRCFSNVRYKTKFLALRLRVVGVGVKSVFCEGCGDGDILANWN